MPISIRIKRGVGGAPTTLLRGELAFDEDNQKLYIGKGDSGSDDANGLPIATSVVELTTPPFVLADLADISVGSGASDGDVLVYDSATGDWVAEALSIAWEDVTSKPASFTPSTHASSHHTGGGDAIAPADIGAAAATHSHAWSDITSGVPSTFTPAAHSHTVTLEISGLIESPEAKTYVLSPSIPAAITITQFKAQTSAGTVDLAVHDDGTLVTGCSLADAGTTLASLASAISESVASGSKLALVVSDLQSSPADLAFSIHYTVASANNA
jgi:hypothetical protein